MYEKFVEFFQQLLHIYCYALLCIWYLSHLRLTYSSFLPSSTLIRNYVADSQELFGIRTATEDDEVLHQRREKLQYFVTI